MQIKNTLGFFETGIGKKLLMSLTGLFLSSFLVIHLIGNLQLLKSDNGDAFNIYSKFMGTNPVIQTISKVNFALIITHIVVALLLTIKNRKARAIGYHTTKPKANSIWSSRNMGILGTIILAFLIIHLGDFWFEFHNGEIPMTQYTDEEGVTHALKNYYLEVMEAFKSPLYVLFYEISFIAIAFHLWHGVQSAFQTLGINHKKYTPAIKFIGYLFAVLIPAGFAIIPLWIIMQ